jgi:thioredoxin-dependent peroxiredoxin
MLKIGDKAPNFCLLDRNAQKVHTSNFFGQWVVLYFYPKDNTPGCTMEARDFSSKLDEIEELRAVVVGVSPDSVKSHFSFCTKNKLRIILLSDKKNEVSEKFGAFREKSIYGKSAKGIVRCTFLINPGGKIVHVWDKVRVKGHVQEVIDTLKKIKNK